MRHASAALHVPKMEQVNIPTSEACRSFISNEKNSLAPQTFPIKVVHDILVSKKAQTYMMPRNKRPLSEADTNASSKSKAPKLIHTYSDCPVKKAEERKGPKPKKHPNVAVSIAKRYETNSRKWSTLM